MWDGVVGPVMVCEQLTERRVPIGHVHRGSGVRKVLFANSGEDSSDGNGNGSGSEVEGGCSRAKNRPRQRSLMIRQDTAGVKRRAAAKAVWRSLPEDPDAAVALVVELGLRQEEESRRRCNAEMAEVAARKLAAVKMQSMREVRFEGSDESGGAEQLPVVDESESQQHRLQSLRKIQRWAWRQQVQVHMDVIRRCFQKWVGGGLAGWFVRNYARRDRQFCRSPTVDGRV